jgi:hypothetical protein
MIPEGFILKGAWCRFATGRWSSKTPLRDDSQRLPVKAARLAKQRCSGILGSQETCLTLF